MDTPRARATLVRLIAQGVADGRLPESKAHDLMTGAGLDWKSSAFLAAMVGKQYTVGRALLQTYGRGAFQWAFLHLALQDCGMIIPVTWLIPSHGGVSLP